MIKKITTIILASVLLVGIVPSVKAAGAPAAQAPAIRAMVTPWSLGLAALGYIWYRSNYWNRVNDRPSYKRWDQLEKAQSIDIARGYDKLSSFVSNWRRKARDFFGIFTFDAGEGHAVDNFDVRNFTKQEQEREDALLARQLAAQDRAAAQRAPRPAQPARPVVQQRGRRR